MYIFRRKILRIFSDTDHSVHKFAIWHSNQDWRSICADMVGNKSRMEDMTPIHLLKATLFKQNFTQDTYL